MNPIEDTDIYQLSENHKRAIEIAKDQIAKGEFLSNEQANKEIGKWIFEIKWKSLPPINNP